MGKKRDRERELYGEGLLGETLAPKRVGNMAEKFMVPPFSVLSAREGWWQDRKRAWLSLGIQSELGRGEDMTWGTGNDLDGFRHGTGMSTAPATDTAPAARSVPANDTDPEPPPDDTPPPTEDDPFADMPEIPVANFRTSGVVAEPPPAVVPAHVDGPAVGHVDGPADLPPLPVLPPATTVDDLPPLPVAGKVAEPPPAFKDPFLEYHRATLDAAGVMRLTFDEDEWDFDDKSPVGLDVECFANFFLACIKRFSNGKRITFELSPRSKLDKEKLLRVLRSARVITFNGNGYDIPMVSLALAGASLERLKFASDRIVRTGLKPWDIPREFNIQVLKLDHVDLLEPNPSVRQGLKMLGARLHTRFVVDLPYGPDAVLTPQQMNVTTLYCMNDIDMTHGLFDALSEPYELRRALSNEYRIDLRSKSDAQIGETIIKMRVEKITNTKLQKHTPREYQFQYKAPPFISFQSPTLKQIVADIAKQTFTANAGGIITPPDMLKNLQIPIGGSVYTMGIGGLHSTEANRAVVDSGDRFIEDIDVASQYPFIILKLGLYPEATGPHFLTAYKQIVDERIEAKKAGNKVKADGLKISVNGVYGKLGSAFSFLYAPHLMVAVTVTGQLSLLMLIERLEAAGVSVVSGNTDGVVIHCPKGLQKAVDDIIDEWQSETGFTTERKRYKGIYNSSVNSYIAIGSDGTVKRKGPLADPWTDGDKRTQLSKNPQMTICSEAVVQFIKHGTPIEQTVKNCTDPRMFVTVIRVATGGTWRGHSLGRVVRYYWATNGSPITYTKDGRKVAKTDGACPLMELTDTLPPNIDWNRYIEEAKKIAVDIGAMSQWQ